MHVGLRLLPIAPHRHASARVPAGMAGEGNPEKRLTC